MSGPSDRIQNSQKTSPQALPLLLNARLVMVTGKGGAGKTTLAASLALRAAMEGRRVLLADAGDADGLSGLLGSPARSPRPVWAAPGVRTLWLDAKAELTEFLASRIRGRLVTEKIAKSRLFGQLFQTIFGLEPLMKMARIWRLVKGSAGLGDPYDLVVVDAPATGHGLGFLQVAKKAADMVKTGGLAEKIRQIHQMLLDKDITRLAVAVVPENPGINEAAGFCRDVRQNPGMEVTAFFANQMIPKTFTGPEEEQILALVKSKSAGPMQIPAQASARLILMRAAQAACLEELVCRTGVPVVELPFLFTHDLTLEQIKILAGELG